jgi:hypothetical protein
MRIRLQTYFSHALQHLDKRRVAAQVHPQH